MTADPTMTSSQAAVSQQQSSTSQVCKEESQLSLYQSQKKRSTKDISATSMSSVSKPLSTMGCVKQWQTVTSVQVPKLPPVLSDQDRIPKRGRPSKQMTQQNLKFKAKQQQQQSFGSETVKKPTEVKQLEIETPAIRQPAGSSKLVSTYTITKTGDIKELAMRQKENKRNKKRAEDFQKMLNEIQQRTSIQNKTASAKDVVASFNEPGVRTRHQAATKTIEAKEASKKPASSVSVPKSRVKKRKSTKKPRVVSEEDVYNFTQLAKEYKISNSILFRHIEHAPKHREVLHSQTTGASGSVALKVRPTVSNRRQPASAAPLPALCAPTALAVPPPMPVNIKRVRGSITLHDKALNKNIKLKLPNEITANKQVALASVHRVTDGQSSNNQVASTSAAAAAVSVTVVNSGIIDESDHGESSKKKLKKSKKKKKHKLKRSKHQNEKDGEKLTKKSKKSARKSKKSSKKDKESPETVSVSESLNPHNNGDYDGHHKKDEQYHHPNVSSDDDHATAGCSLDDDHDDFAHKDDDQPQIEQVRPLLLSPSTPSTQIVATTTTNKTSSADEQHQQQVEEVGMQDADNSSVFGSSFSSLGAMLPTFRGIKEHGGIPQPVVPVNALLNYYEEQQQQQQQQQKQGGTGIGDITSSSTSSRKHKYHHKRKKHHQHHHHGSAGSNVVKRLSKNSVIDPKFVSKIEKLSLQLRQMHVYVNKQQKTGQRRSVGEMFAGSSRDICYDNGHKPHETAVPHMSVFCYKSFFQKFGLIEVDKQKSDSEKVMIVDQVGGCAKKVVTKPSESINLKQLTRPPAEAVAAAISTGSKKSSASSDLVKTDAVKRPAQSETATKTNKKQKKANVTGVKVKENTKAVVTVATVDDAGGIDSNSLSLKTKPQQQQRSAKKKTTTTTTTSAAVEAAVMHEQTTSSTSSPPPSLADAKINMQLMNHIKAQMTQALAQLPAAAGADDDHIAASVVNQTIDSAIKSYIGQQHQQQQQQQTKAVHDKTGVVDTNEKQPQSIDTKSVSCSGGSMSGYSQQRKGKRLYIPYTNCI